MAQRLHAQKLVERIRFLPALPAAIVYPCDGDSLQLALSGAFAGYLAPTLVGPERMIRDTAARLSLDISRLPLVDTPDVPRAAAERAIALAREGTVEALVKGALSDPDLLAPVAQADSGLRTDCRLSHATFLDLPGFDRLLLLADAHLNVAPALAAKKDIVHNTVRLAMVLGLAAPAVALLAAVDAVTPAFASTADAAALRAMAADGLFPGAVVDGPMTPDIALFGGAQGVLRSDIAGRADVLIAWSMEAAILVNATLTGMTGGLASSLVLKARVPIVATPRAAGDAEGLASCVLASLAKTRCCSSRRRRRSSPAAAARVRGLIPGHAAAAHNGAASRPRPAAY